MPNAAHALTKGRTAYSLSASMRIAEPFGPLRIPKP